MKVEIQRWEGEGGAVLEQALELPVKLRGSESQVEWALRIRRAVNTEFDRVAKALLSATSKQSPQDRNDAKVIIAILEEKRAEVMAIDMAGYFIREWQEMDGRVGQMIMKDARYAGLRERRAERRSPRLRESGGNES